MRKVPTLTIYFWIVKILTTACGEATSDYLVGRFNPVPVVILGFVAMIGALAIQIFATRYTAWKYWLAALMVSVFGTMGADVVHVRLGIPYAVSASACLVALAATFYLWNRVEGTLSIHSIETRRRECFYWTAALVTFALGTATGDLTAVTFHLGYLSSGVMFAIVFAVPALGFWRFKFNGVFAFWFAYIITRPLGASFADWVSKPRASRGLGHGDGVVALVLLLFILAFVFYLAVTHIDEPQYSNTERQRQGWAGGDRATGVGE